MKNGHECIMLCFTNHEKPIGCNHFPEISNNICARKGLGTLSVNILYLQMVDAKGSEGSKKYTCENCNYHTSRLSQFNKHLLTAKHKMFTNVYKKSQNVYTC